jgi:hypothetical protein
MNRTAILKRHNLTDVMADALIYDVDPAQGTIYTSSTATAVALIQRGLCTPRMYGAGSDWASRGYAHHLTDHGARVRAELRQDAGLTNRIPMKDGLRKVWRDRETIVKAERLTAGMIADIMYGRDGYGPVVQDDSILLVSKRTETALVARGILHPTKSILTAKGLDLVRELKGRPAEETPEVHVYEVGDKVTAPRRPDLGVGEVKEISLNRYGQLLHIVWEDSSVRYSSQSDTVEPYVEPTTGAAAQFGEMRKAREAAAERYQEALRMRLSGEETTDYVAQTGRWAPEPEETSVTAEQAAQDAGLSWPKMDLGTPMSFEDRLKWSGAGTPRFTARIVERDESADFMARHPELDTDREATAAEVSEVLTMGVAVTVAQAEKITQLEAEVESLKQRLTTAEAQRDTHAMTIIGLIGDDRDQDTRMAKSIAHWLSQDWVTSWSSEKQMNVSVPVPKGRMPYLLAFAANGSINAARLLQELRYEMLHTVRQGGSMGPVGDSQVGEDVAWLGWLHAWVLRQGGVSADTGWARRDRGKQAGWDDIEIFDLDPSEAEELPAQFDVNDGEDLGCTGVINGGGRYSEPEHCGEQVSREEYFRQGSEECLCAMHRLAAEVADEKPW